MNPTEPLPTIEAVRRYMTDWRIKVQQAPGLKDATITCHAPCAGMDTTFRMIVWDGASPESFQGSTPEEVIAKAVKDRDPKRKAAALRAEAQAKLKEAEALESAS